MRNRLCSNWTGRLSLTFALTLLVTGVGAGQDVRLGGVVYSQYSYQLADTAEHANSFDVTRAYLNIIGTFDGGVGTRVTGDVYRNTDGSLSYRLKYAFVTWRPEGSALTYKFGQIQTPWMDFEETLWGYRMQGSVAVDRAGYLTSSDFGGGVDGSWAGEAVNMQVALANGSGYNRVPGTDQWKDVQGRLSVRLLATDDSSKVGGLRLTGYGHLGGRREYGTRNRSIGMLSYRSKLLTLAGVYGMMRDFGATPEDPKVDGRLVSGFGVLNVPDSKVAFIARADVVDPNMDLSDDRQTRLIGGVSYQVSPNLRALVDLDHLMYQGGAPTPALEAVRSKALFQVQFTF